jgi:hypothetical protein
VKKPVIALFLLLSAAASSSITAQTGEQPLTVAFSPAEVESMLFLYNQTPVKGADVEMVAPVGAKLRAGLKQARAQQDSTKSVPLQLLPVEIQVCLGIIQASTFEAKYAELVLGMKRKLEAFAGQPGVPPVQSADEKGGRKK